MKLYYWTRVRCLASIFPGHAIVVAESLEEAIDVAICQYKDDDCWYDDASSFRKELEETKPDIHAIPCAVLIEGSD